MSRSPRDIEVVFVGLVKIEDFVRLLDSLTMAGLLFQVPGLQLTESAVTGVGAEACYGCSCYELFLQCSQMRLMKMFELIFFSCV